MVKAIFHAPGQFSLAVLEIIKRAFLLVKRF